MLLFFAFAVSGGVGVGVFALNTVCLDVLEGRVHKSSLASFVSLGTGAVNELLLGERLEASLFLSIKTLNGGNGGEGPARSTLSLILDGGDDAVSSPINKLREVVGVEVDRVVGILELNLQREVSGSEFLSSEIGELVEAELVRALLVSVSLDEEEVGFEDLESVGLLAVRAIDLVVLDGPLKESLIDELLYLLVGCSEEDAVVCLSEAASSIDSKEGDSGSEGSDGDKFKCHRNLIMICL